MTTPGERTDLEAVTTTVQERIDPTPEERDRLAATAERLIERAEAAVADQPVDGEVMQVGSTARGTWISGDRDIDIFVCYPPSIDRAELEEYGLEVGHEILPDGREEYAEHPYVTGTVDGFDVDLVPCYAVDSATEIRSAVDRTPFHTAYIERRLTDELAAEIRLFKQFLKGIGAYGSNLRTRGFSGYLTELLVLEYGSFETVVSAAADWHPPVELDPAGHAAESFDDPLVVIDPTDPERNVAAVCSAENVARLQHYARELLATPRKELFFPEPIEPIDADELATHIDRRSTTPVTIVFETPDLVDDQLYPQLRKSLAGITDELDRRGFDVVRKTCFANGRSVLYIELGVAERPAVERHAGPPVHVGDHAAGFYEKYADTDDPMVYGPFIDGDRYIVERERSFTDAISFLNSEAILETRLGPAIESAIETDYSVLVGEEITELTEEFGTELARYYEPRP
ncbi:MAG: CCA tRNA nucleotidyltransferase [Halobacteriales archaeon]